MDDEGGRDQSEYRGEAQDRDHDTEPPAPDALDSTRADAIPANPDRSDPALSDPALADAAPSDAAASTPTRSPTGSDASGSDATLAAPDGAPTPGEPSAGPTGTSVLPVVPPPAEAPRWSARAQVRAPEAEPEPANGYWPGAEDQPPRGVLGPALIAVVAVVLVGVLVVGVWLLLRGGSGTVQPSPSTEVTTATAPATTPPHTSAAPTTTAAAPVSVPDLHGQDYAAAAAALTQLGLVPKRSEEPNTTVPAGKVIDTDPPAGNVLPPGTTVVVSVSAGAPTPTPTLTPTSAPASPPVSRTA